jgi:hypothetical protein
MSVRHKTFLHWRPATKKRCVLRFWMKTGSTYRVAGENNFNNKSWTPDKICPPLGLGEELPTPPRKRCAFTKLYRRLNSSVMWIITRYKVVWNRRYLQGSNCPRSRPLKMGPIGSPKTSVANHPTKRNNPEDGRIQFNPGGSQRFRTA